MAGHNANLPTRRPVRLRGFDYGQSGAYFVTICTHERLCSLGDVRDGAVTLGPAGRIIQDVWDSLTARFHDVATDAFVIMPNHIHGVIILGASNIIEPVGAQFIEPATSPAPATSLPLDNVRPSEASAGAMNRAPTLGQCVRALKAASTRLIRVNVMPEFAWQRNFYDRIIRDETEFWHVREYIKNNPANWASDSNNPAVICLPPSLKSTLGAEPEP